MCTLQVEVREPLTFESQFFPFPTWDSNEPSYWLKIGVIKKKIHRTQKKSRGPPVWRQHIYKQTLLWHGTFPPSSGQVLNTTPHNAMSQTLCQIHPFTPSTVLMPKGVRVNSDPLTPSCNSLAELLSPAAGCSSVWNILACSWAYTPEIKVNFGNAVMGPSLSHSFTLLWDYNRA